MEGKEENGKGRTYSVRSRHEGDPSTTRYRVFFEDQDGAPLSPFHDIPLVADAEKGIFNVVIEIPRGTKAKFEISKEETFNPIKQDVKAGKLRFVEYGGGYMWNYGAFPQTWEHPEFAHPDTHALGDNDPLDVCEIGDSVATVGEVKQVKVLGVMGLIDEGETDWKILAIDVRDPLAEQLEDVDDIERVKPGYIERTRTRLREYKSPIVNELVFEGKAKPREYALKLIEEYHAFWKELAVPEVAEKYGIDVTGRR